MWINHQPPNAGSTFQCYNIWRVLLKPISHFTRFGVRKIRSWFFSQRGGGKAKPYKSFLQIKFISTHTHPSFFPSNSDSYCCILNLVGRFWEVWNWFSLIPFEILHLENWPWNLHLFYLVIFLLCCSVAKSGLTLCDLLDCSMPGTSVLHHLYKFALIHIHWVSNII